MPELSSTEIVTPPLRLAFPALFQPKPVTKGSEDLKYQAVLLVPPDVDTKPFLECMAAAMQASFGKIIKLPPQKNPIRPCEEKPDVEGYLPNWKFINVKSGYKPPIVDQALQPISDPERVFPGCWCRFHLNCYAWTHDKGGKGVSFSLESVQLIRDDERLDAKRKPSELFEAIEAGPDDMPPESDDSDPAAALFG